MINKLELENLKQIYLKLSDNLDEMCININNILSNINDLTFNLHNYCLINNMTIDNGLIEKNKLELDFINKYLKNDIKFDILNKISQIDEQLNS